MSSTDGIRRLPSFDAERPQVPASPGKTPAKTAEEYVEIENRLAAQVQKPADPAQFTSIFDQLRQRLPR